MSPKATKAKVGPKVKADKTKQEAKAKAAAKAAAKAEAHPASSQLAVEAKKEQQNFVNTLTIEPASATLRKHSSSWRHIGTFFLFLKNISCTLCCNFCLFIE